MMMLPNTEYQALRITSEGYEYTTDRIQVNPSTSSTLTSILYESNHIPRSSDVYIPENRRRKQRKQQRNRDRYLKRGESEVNNSNNDNTTTVDERKLIVIGDDTRYKIVNTRKYPYTTNIQQITFNIIIINIF